MISTAAGSGRAIQAATRRAEPGRDFVPDDAYLSRLNEAFGTECLDLAIGPLRFRMEGLSAPQASTLSERYRTFLAQPPGRMDLVISLRKAEVPRFLAPPDGAVEEYRLGSRSRGDRLTLWAYEFAGWLEAPRARASLALVEAEGPWFDRGLENFLRVMTARYILERDGFLLHASCVVRGGRAYVFFGPSGSGKTTVTWLSPGDTVLSDDLTLVIPRGEAFCAAGIPFGMAHHRVPDTNDAFPIASFNRLVQSPEVARERIAGARALAELSGSLPFVMLETGDAARAIAVVGRLLETVPAYRLKFRKDGSFWSVVEGA